MNESYYVDDVAIAIMYMMLDSQTVPLLDVGGHVLAGYLTQRRLNDAEWSALRLCVAARYAQSLIMGAYSHSLEAGNEYLLTTTARGWPRLQQIWRTSDEELLRNWRNVIATYRSI